MNSTDLRLTQQNLLARLFQSWPQAESVFPDLDPYSLTYVQELITSFDSVAAGLWPKLQQYFPHHDPIVVLGNAWVIALQKPMWMALLYRSVVTAGPPQAVSEATRLLGLTMEELRPSPYALAVIEPSHGGLNLPPNLGSRTSLKPGLRLRYALAHAWTKGASLANLVRLTTAQPNTSNYLRRRELMRAINAGHTMRSPVARLSEVEFFMLSEREQTVATESQDLVLLTLPDSLQGRRDLTVLAAASRASQEATRLQLTALREQLLGRSFPEAETAIVSLTDDSITRVLAAEVASDFAALTLGESTLSKASIRTNMAAGRRWPQLSACAAGKLESLIPNLKLPVWWSMSAGEIAQAMSAGKLSSESVNPLDFFWIQASWQEPTLAVLTSARRFDLLPPESTAWNQLDLLALLRAAARNRQAEKIVYARILKLPDARPVLATLSEPDGPAIKALVGRSLRHGPRNSAHRSWIDWAISCLGTVEWNTHPPLTSTRATTSTAALALLQRGESPVDADGFRVALVDLLLLQEPATAAKADTMQKLFSRDPLAIDLVNTRMPPSRLKALLASPKLSLPVLDRFMALVPESLRETVWTNRLAKATTAEVLRKVLIERAEVSGRIPWHEYWTKIEGTESERAVALILSCRRDPKRLRSLSAQLDSNIFATAIWRAAEALPDSARRDRGFLELIGALGAHQIPYLSAVMAMADRSAAAGHKFDQAYRKYLLPKKSGGSRVISAPHPHLKRIQRAVLDSLLQPLGAHECAHGFVPGRSIRGNASVHVGQPIVTNADVRNCFPSVKWPLVLGVFRREFGHKLAPGAISLLVDICTADGGLPIGAPSSPALLNRVLLRTDIVLQTAAERLHCRYSRYADDLTFSGDHGAVKLLGIAKRTLSQIGLEFDPDKTNIYRRGRRQIVTGLVVNDGVSVPRRLRRRMRAAVHAVELGRTPQWHGKEEPTAALMGRLAFVSAVNTAHAAPLKKRLVRALRRTN